MATHHAKRKYDRASIADAQSVFEHLIPDLNHRIVLAKFLLDAINYTEFVCRAKWNINLDLGGLFIRFNVGHLYCIQIEAFPKKTLILCNRKSAKSSLLNYLGNVEFLGYDSVNKRNIHSYSIDDVPDSLQRAKDSIGCLVNVSELSILLPALKEANRDFIKSAAKTPQFERNRTAHSPGVIRYLQQLTTQAAFNDWAETRSLDEHLADEENRILHAKKRTTAEREQRLKNADPNPSKRMVHASVFNRNEDVVVAVLERANGICQRCRNNAPFLRDSDGLPYLEVHHKTPLAEGGLDMVENAIALCPNCHRHAHLGKRTF